MKVLVTDGESRSALAVTRSLGRRGHSVFVTGVDKRNISNSSKYCTKAISVPDSLVDSAEYSSRILDIVRNEAIDVVFPMTEQSIYSLNRVRDDFGEGTILACAPADKMEAVSDKYRLFHMAKRLGVAIPATNFVSNADELLAGNLEIQSFPVVVKPALSRIQEGDRILTTGVMYAQDPQGLLRLYETKPALRYPSMIQELIVGEGTGLFTLFDEDRHLALFSHRRLLEKPPSGGVSVMSESVPLDDEMVEASRKLLAEVEWRGVAMVEFKRDVRDGRAKLMEINGRFWGSLQLAVSSGVDFPALSLDYYLGKKAPSHLSDYLVGHKLKWFFGILDHIIIRMKMADHFQNLPPGSPSRLQVIKELLKVVIANTSFDVYDSKDIKPFLSEIKTYIKDIIQ